MSEIKIGYSGQLAVTEVGMLTLTLTQLAARLLHFTHFHVSE